MSEDNFTKIMKNIFNDLESVKIKTFKPGHPEETDIEIYSYITKKTYSSEQEYKKDIRKFKLKKLNAL